MTGANKKDNNFIKDNRLIAELMADLTKSMITLFVEYNYGLRSIKTKKKGLNNEVSMGKFV